MPTVHTLARHVSVALLTLGLLGAPSTLAAVQTPGPPDFVSAQIMAMSGTGLKLADCEQRMQTLEAGGQAIQNCGRESAGFRIGCDATCLPQRCR